MASQISSFFTDNGYEDLWSAAVAEYMETGRVSRCPVCGGTRVDTEGFISRIDRNECVWFFCLDCGRRAKVRRPGGLHRFAPKGSVVDLAFI